MLIAIIFCVFGCSNNDPGPVTSSTPDSTIHLAGIASVGSYWKNGIYSAVGNDGEVQVQSMSVDGSSVLISGFVCCADARNVIWQNGKEIVVGHSGQGMTLVASRGDDVFSVVEGRLYKNGTTTEMDKVGWPTAMALLGDDIYSSGASQGNDYPWEESPFYPLDTYAICWKNEQEFFRETENSNANTIFIHEGDIYLGGHLNHYPSLDKIACYWKNGQRFALTDETQDAEVRSLFITDEHIYAAGVLNDQAVYWQDGVATTLSHAKSVANSISILGTDVYVAGQEDVYPAVWKNGVRQSIPNQDKLGEIKVVVAVSN
jgi:hypothetical protein